MNPNCSTQFSTTNQQKYGHYVPVVTAHSVKGKTTISNTKEVQSEIVLWQSLGHVERGAKKKSKGKSQSIFEGGWVYVVWHSNRDGPSDI